jgi:hypothetical protein
MSPPPVLARPRWAWILGIWGGIGLCDATQTVVVMRAIGMHHAWVALYVKLLLAWLPWALATPTIMRCAVRHPLAALRQRPAATIAMHAITWGLTMLAAVTWSALLTWVLNPWTPDRPPRPLWDLFVGNLHDGLLSSTFLYAAILMAGTVLEARERIARQQVESARLAEALAQAQLDALRHQVEPHFLFNALNTVSGLVREGENARAVDTLARVSDFLRHLLKDEDQEVTLSQELQFATLYLGIQQVRFADRLQVDVAVAPELAQAVVPRLILQPLVENAVKHGIARRAQPGAIAIGAAREAGRLVLTVYNDGPPMAANDAPRSDGDEARDRPIGLANVRQRLRGLHGDAATLAVDNVGTRGVRVSITLPWRVAGEARRA